MKVFLIILGIFFAQSLWAHAFYFAFAEMQYNAKEERFEITLRATGHDVEKYMEVQGMPIGKLEDCVNNPIKKKQLETVINRGFSISIGKEKLVLDMIGLEVGIDDEVSFYLVSRKIPTPQNIEVYFGFLMDYFEEQQNKLTIFDQGEKAYLSFLPHLTKRTYDFIKP